MNTLKRKSQDEAWPWIDKLPKKSKKERKIKRRAPRPNAAPPSPEPLDWESLDMYWHVAEFRPAFQVTPERPIRTQARRPIEGIPAPAPETPTPPPKKVIPHERSPPDCNRRVLFAATEEADDTLPTQVLYLPTKGCSVAYAQHDQEDSQATLTCKLFSQTEVVVEDDVTDVDE